MENVDLWAQFRISVKRKNIGPLHYMFISSHIGRSSFHRRRPIGRVGVRVDPRASHWVTLGRTHHQPVQCSLLSSLVPRPGGPPLSALYLEGTAADTASRKFSVSYFIASQAHGQPQAGLHGRMACPCPLGLAGLQALVSKLFLNSTSRSKPVLTTVTRTKVAAALLGGCSEVQERTPTSA